VIEIRAKIDSMTLDDVDDLTSEEAEQIESKVQDPLDEELQQTAKPNPLPTITDDETPFGMEEEAITEAANVLDKAESRNPLSLLRSATKGAPLFYSQCSNSIQQLTTRSRQG